VDEVSWRWIFYVNLPIGIATFAFALAFLREHTEPAAGRFDVWGFVCSGAALCLLLYGLSQGPNRGWQSPAVIASCAAATALFFLLIAIELGRPDPMLHLRLFRDRMFRNGSLVMFMAFAMLFGVLFVLPLFLQQLRGLSAFDSGLATFPQALGLMLMVQVSSRVYRYVGPRRMLTVGLTGLTATSVLFLLVGLDTDLWWIRAIMFMRGASMSFAMVAAQAATFSTIPSRETGRASSLYNTNRQVAASVGVAVLATVLIEQMNANLPDMSMASQLLAFHDAFAASIVFGLIGILFALRIHDEDAAESMRSPTATSRSAAVSEPRAAERAGAGWRYTSR
jgi:EmrB/QacA subfamily drug resistance transporter